MRANRKSWIFWSKTNFHWDCASQSVQFASQVSVTCLTGLSFTPNCSLWGHVRLKVAMPFWDGTEL